MVVEPLKTNASFLKSLSLTRRLPQRIFFCLVSLLRPISPLPIRYGIQVLKKGKLAGDVTNCPIFKSQQPHRKILIFCHFLHLKPLLLSTSIACVSIEHCRIRDWSSINFRASSTLFAVADWKSCI